MATNGVDERGPDEQRPELWRDPLLVLWLVLPAAVWASHGFHAALGRDGALYVHAGQAVADGDPPYVAVMNRLSLLPSRDEWDHPAARRVIERWVGRRFRRDPVAARALSAHLMGLSLEEYDAFRLAEERYANR